MYTRDMKRMRQTTGSTPLQTPWQVSHRVKVNNRKTFLFMHSFAPISLLQVNLFLRSIPREKKKITHGNFSFPSLVHTYNLPCVALPNQARRSWQGTGRTCRRSGRTTSRRRGIPVEDESVWERRRFAIMALDELTMPVIFPPSGKLSSLSSAAW